MSRATQVFLSDLLLAALAWLGAFWLRFNLDVPPEFQQNMLEAMVVVIPVQGLVFFIFGLYRGLWRFASVSDLKRILLAGGVVALATPAALVMARYQYMVPRSVFVLDPLLLVMLMGGVRFAYRAWKDGHFFLRRTGSGTPVLIVGAGEMAARLIKELEGSRIWQVVGVADVGSAQSGRAIGGIPILGSVDDLAMHATQSEARHVIIAMPQAAAAERRRVAELAGAIGLSVMTVPSLDDLLTGRVGISSIRKVELEDLLGRDRIALDDEGLYRLLTGKVVLVSGAGGSIGSELCRQIMRFNPRRLVFYELSEFALYTVAEEFRGKPVACVVGDIKDEAALAATFQSYHPEVVFHAAAYKHVPLMEDENAWQAVRNNVLGTWRVARAAITHGVGEFVLISTDKAVNPTNVMGASKRLAERVCEALQQQSADTRFIVVRFGNVLGSSGSVIPKFREQIGQGGPVTVTHPDIVRYFMLIPEAAQLVLQAGLMGKGGEIFVLDMGEPVKIVDLALDMIRLSGFTDDDIRIEFTGLRPGEKLYEELLADGETTLATPHPKLRVMRAEAAPDEAWLAELGIWLDTPVRSSAEVKEALRRWVPEYRPTSH